MPKSAKRPRVSLFLVGVERTIHTQGLNRDAQDRPGTVNLCSYWDF